jgi:uncharacterized membrane protein
MRPSSRTSNQLPDRSLRLASIFIAVLGAADALYLLIYKYSSNDRMCLGSGDCATVNYSPYSEIYGIPIALLGLLAYLVLLAILVLEPRVRLLRENGPLAVFGISLAGVAFSAYLTYIELFVIFAVCPFCVVSAVTMTLIFILAIIRLVKQNAS